MAGKLTQLKDVALGHNQFKQFPKALYRCCDLRSVSMPSNRIFSLPGSISNMTQIHSLDLSWNQIHDLPHGFGQLTQLTNLRLDGNPLEWPPWDFVLQHKSFAVLKWEEHLARLRSQMELQSACRRH